VCPVFAYARERGMKQIKQQKFEHESSICGIGTHVGLFSIHGGPQ